jgi:hypothetical protein
MSYATNTMCRKCNQLTLTGEKLACGRILCEQCRAKWNCSCEICNDKGNTFVIREGFCKVCSEPLAKGKHDLCEKCKTNTEIQNNEQSESIWDWLWGVGSKFTCGPLFVGEQSKEDFEDVKEHELQIIDPSGMETMTVRAPGRTRTNRSYLRSIVHDGKNTGLFHHDNGYHKKQ